MEEEGVLLCALIFWFDWWLRRFMVWAMMRWLGMRAVVWAMMRWLWMRAMVWAVSMTLVVVMAVAFPMVPMALMMLTLVVATLDIWVVFQFTI